MVTLRSNFAPTSVGKVFQRSSAAVQAPPRGARAGFDGHVAHRHALLHRHRTDRFTAVFEHVTGATRHAHLADDGENQIFGRHADGQTATHVDLERLRFLLQQALRREHVADFRGADAEGEGAECTVRRGVAVAAHDGVTGLCEPEFRTDDVHDTAARVLQPEQFDAEGGAIFFELTDLFRCRVDGDRRAAEHLLGARRRRVIHGREGEVGATHPQFIFSQ